MRALEIVTPPGLLLTAGLTGMYAVFAGGIALADRSWFYAGVSAFAGIASVGAALAKPWSRYLVWLLTTLVIGEWLLSIYHGIQSEYFAFMFSSWQAALQALVPGVLLVLLSSFCSYAIGQAFKKKPSQSTITPTD